MAGRGTHEKVIAELKTGYAFDTVATQNYAANSTWQILTVVAHNLITNFQIETGAPHRGRTRKRRSHFLIRSIRTLRFERFNKAGVVLRPGGKKVLSLAKNLPTRRLFETISQRLQMAA